MLRGTIQTVLHMVPSFLLHPVERSLQTVVKGLGTIFQVTKSAKLFGELCSSNASNSCPNAVSGEYPPIFHFTGKWVLERFKFNLRCRSSYLKSKFTFTPHGEFSFAIGAAQNGAILPHVSSTSSAERIF
jgi:hypothetical protein